MGINLDSSKLAADGFGTTVEGLRQAVGGFAQQEGETFSGQLERLKNNLGDIGESVGQGAAGVLGGFAQGAADAAKALNDVNPGILTAVGGIGATGGVVATLAGGFAVAAGSAIDFTNNVKQGNTALLKVGEDGSRSLTKVGKAAAGIAVVGAIAGIIQTVATVADSINDIDRKTTDAFDNLRSNINGTSADLTTAFGDLVEVEDKSAEFAGIWQGLGKELTFGNFSADIEEVDAAFTQILDTFGPEAAQKVVDGLRAQNAALDANSQQYKDNAAFIEESQKRINLRTEANKQATIAERNQKRATQESVEQYDRETGTLEGVQLSLKDYQDRLKQLTSEYDVNTAAAKGFAEQIERGTVADDQIASAISYNEALGKFLETASALPDELDAVSIALGGVGTATDQLGEDALQNFLSVADAAKGLLATFIQAGDPEGARQLADQLRNQIATALAAQGMDPAQIQQFLEASGLTSVQVDAAINFANVEAELLRVNTLIDLFEQQLRDAPPEVFLRIDKALAENDLGAASALIRGWVQATSTDPTTSQIGVNAILKQFPELKPYIDAAQLAADQNPVRIPVTVGDVTVNLDPNQVLPGIDANKEKLYNIDLNGNGIIGRRIGGPVTGKTPYIVGEAGPELFVPNTSGRIVPNNQLAGETNQTFNIYSTDPMLTASEVVRKQRDAAFMAGV
jgi:plasmid stabilization system protein ParE